MFSALKSTIEASDFFKNNPGRMSEKFFILLPSSCEVPKIDGGGEGRKPLVKKEGNLTIQAAHGDKSRHYNPTVYSVEDNGEVLYENKSPLIFVYCYSILPNEYSFYSYILDIRCVKLEYRFYFFLFPEIML